MAFGGFVSIKKRQTLVASRASQGCLSNAPFDGKMSHQFVLYAEHTWDFTWIAAAVFISDFVICLLAPSGDIDCS